MQSMLGTMTILAILMPSLLDINLLELYDCLRRWKSLPEKYLFCNRLKLARVERDLNQGDLAVLSGVTRQTISSIETGQYIPSTKLALILAKKLNKDVNDLFYLEEEPK
jgi:putative transcriptional regulator